jgi:small redox-active disulfide protein 2
VKPPGELIHMKGVDRLEIKILGTGCPKCREVEKRVKDVVAEMDVPADIEKVSDIKGIMAYGILATPGLVIDGKLKSSGRVPRAEEIKAWISQAVS